MSDIAVQQVKKRSEKIAFVFHFAANRGRLNSRKTKIYVKYKID